jgi:hypothetical protein
MVRPLLLPPLNPHSDPPAIQPGDYLEPGFTNCEANRDLPVAVYNSTYTFAQGQAVTPPPVAAPSSSNVRPPTPSQFITNVEMGEDSARLRLAQQRAESLIRGLN